jgi:hypothetical protein
MANQLLYVWMQVTSRTMSIHLERERLGTPKGGSEG